MAAGRGKNAQLAAALDRLEARYGKLVTSDDPVEAGVLTLLAMHASKFSTPATRERLREAFVDWNEMRVSDPWDVAVALEAPDDPQARAFGRAALRFLESMNAVLHRTSFEAAKADPQADLGAVLEKMRGAPPPVRAVVLAVLDAAGGWRPGPEMAKTLQKIGVVGKTSSAAKAGKEAQEAAEKGDRLRAHYLLTRYGVREKDEDDPLDGDAKKPAPAEKKPKKAKAASGKE
jgi:hypothetical protein